MEGMLITDIQVWFGVREPEWWPEDEDEDFEDRILQQNRTFRKARIVKIRRNS